MASHVQPVSLNAILHLGISPPALHSLGAGLIVGSSLWGSFVSGVIAFKTLPRQQFGNLQARTFPVYFAQTTALTTGLLLNWLWRHPGLLATRDSPLLQPRLPAAFNAWLLITMFGACIANQFYIGPITTGLMKQRHKLERSEGKSYQDPTASEEMKSLSKRFGYAHGVSSVVNLIFFGLSGLHLAWIGAHGF